MANLPEGATPVNVPASVGIFLKLGKKGDFLTGRILGFSERDDKYNPGKTELNYTFEVEKCESHKREQDEMGNWVASKDVQDVPAGSTASLKVSGDLKRMLSQLSIGQRVHIIYGGITMKENAKTKAKIKAGVWEVYSLPDTEKDSGILF